MVEARGAPVVGELTEVEVVPLPLGPPARDDGLGPCVVGDRRQPRRAAQTLLGPGDRDVDVPAVDGDLAPAERHDAVGDQERSVSVSQLRDLGERLQGAGRGLAWTIATSLVRPAPSARSTALGSISRPHSPRTATTSAP